MIYILILLILSACGSSSKAEHLSHSVKSINSDKIYNSLSVKHNYFTKDIDKSWEDIKITHIVYDTCENQGEQKIASKTVYEKSRRNDKQREANDSDVLVEGLKKAKITQHVDSVRHDTTKEKLETQIPKQINNTVRALCILIGLLIVWYLVRRYGKK